MGNPSSGGSRWRGWVISAGLITAGLVFVGALAMLPKQEIQTPPVQIKPVNVEVQRVVAVPELADTVELTGVVEPFRVVKVAAEVAGRLERYGERSKEATWQGRTFAAGSPVAEGEPVSAGDTLVYLNKELLQARFDRARAQFDYDEREYLRLLDLFERGSTSKTELDDARTRRELSRASLDEAARALDRTALKAPLNGLLNRWPMELGEYAGPGGVVAELVELHTVHVVVDVPERDVVCLNIGDRVDVLAIESNGTPRTGEITFINALADEQTRTTRIELTVANDTGRLRSGQIVRARLTRRMLRDVVMVPLAAVIPLERGREVYVVEDGRAQRRLVELDFLKGRDVRVLDGVQPGDLLIVAGHRLVGPGQPVSVVAEQAGNTGAPPGSGQETARLDRAPRQPQP